MLPHHLNPNGTCHGGMLASFCDVLLPLSTLYQLEALRLMMPTISLSLDYLEPTRAGAWVESRVEVLRVGRRMAFIQGLLTVAGRTTVRANGTFSVRPPEANGVALGDGLRRLLSGRARTE